MQGANRTITRLALYRLLLGALLIAAFVPATSAVAAGRAPTTKGAWSSTFPEGVHGIAVAIGPDGNPWFGVSVQEKGPQLGRVRAGKLELEPLRNEPGYQETSALQFDRQGALWFARAGQGPPAIVRRDPNGTLTEFTLPQGEPVTALTIGPEGDVWFARGGYAEKSESQIGRLTPEGAITQFPLAPGSHPGSIAFGSDGALWFSETEAGEIGRITTSGEVGIYPLAPKVRPGQIVAGAEGALWFGENARARPYGKLSDRIGRITTEGQVSELPIPFGTGTSRLAADPRGVIWFATDEGEFASISPSGNVGARGCVVSCGAPIVGLALAPDGGLWFAAGHAACLECGGGADLILENEGTSVGEIPAGALAPADPAGPPAEDPYAKNPGKPPPPIARTGKPEAVRGGSTELTGFINSRGFSTTWLFKWGKTKAYGHRGFVPEFPFRAGEGGGEVYETVLGLCPGTTYHFEIVAFGPGGRTSGGDRTFKTKPAKHPPRRCRRP
jgi:virginiamycin B lyase